MNRSELLGVLTRAQPGLAANDLIPIMTHFWFQGDRIMAYNDKIAISVRCKTDIEAALPGKTLLGFLKASRAKEIELGKKEGESIVMKASGAKIKLATIALNKIFEMPKPAKRGLNVDIEALLKAITNCMRSVADDTSAADQMGITIIPDDKGLTLYSTNRATVSLSSVPAKDSGLKERVILPTEFCKQLLSLKIGEVKAGKLEITGDYALFTGSDFTLFGKILFSDQPLDFPTLMAKHFSPTVRKQLTDVPKSLGWALERALVIFSGDAADGKTMFTIKGGKLKMFSKSNRGELADMMTFANHADVEIKSNPKWLKVGCEAFDRIAITEDAIVMTDGDALDVYLIATS